MLIDRFFKIIVLSAFLLSLAGCGGVDPPRPDKLQSIKKENPAQPIPSTDHLVVYLDTSASMAGYVSPNGKAEFGSTPEGTVFSRTLLELRKVVTTMNPQPEPVVRRVDTNISAPSKNDLDLTVASVNRTIFNGKETNLAGAIKTFSEPLEKDSENQAPPRFHVLVTDGVQSSDKNNMDVPCGQGSDSFCVKKQLLELVRKGWGGAVFGMKSEFNGNIYSEITHKPVPYVSGKDQNRFRPFYLYVFSPDRPALDKLVDTLRQKLAPLNREDAFREYALTTDYSNGIESIEIVQEKQTRDLLEARQEKSKAGELPRIMVKSSLNTETAGKQQFIIKVKPAWTAHAMAGGSADELARMIKWEQVSIFPDKEDSKLRYPVFTLVKNDIREGGVYLTFETGWIKDSGDPAWRMYQMIGKLDVSHAAPPWVSAWTTNLDSTVDTANKTLNLESSLANLWNNPFLENYPVAEFGVLVGEK